MEGGVQVVLFVLVDDGVNTWRRNVACSLV